jgi:hypothetical protein
MSPLSGDNSVSARPTDGGLIFKHNRLARILPRAAKLQPKG